MSFILEKMYHIPSGAFIVSGAPLLDRSKIFKDWEDFGSEKLPEYFDNGYKKFQERLESFKVLTRPLSAEEEQELGFMLEALIHAKNAQFEATTNN